jgi:hypothetical protein
LNENTNGLLRQYFSKSTDFKKVTQAEVRSAVRQWNNRPRKHFRISLSENIAPNAIKMYRAFHQRAKFDFVFSQNGASDQLGAPTIFIQLKNGVGNLTCVINFLKTSS